MLEADNQRLFAEFYADHPFIDVPAVIDEWCSARVITTELAEGVRYSELLTWSQPERDLAAESIYRYVFGSLYRLHAFNGDPHPGNYLFRPGGRVSFLDYGLVKRFGQAELTVFEDMITKWVARARRARVPQGRRARRLPEAGTTVHRRGGGRVLRALLRVRERRTAR